MKIAALPSSGNDVKIVLTYFLMVELALILRRGLITLRILNGLRLILTAIISNKLNSQLIYFLPCNNDNEIDDIPWFSQIRSLADEESHGNNLN